MAKEEIIRFPYVKEIVTDPLTKQVGEAYRPIIPIRLIHGNKSCRFLALIDSGADECTFPGAIAEFLGHNLTKGKPKVFTGIGGSVLAFLHQTILEIDKLQFKVNVFYSNEWNRMGFGLLGQSGFFTQCKVLLDYQNKEVSLILTE